MNRINTISREKLPPADRAVAPRDATAFKYFNPSGAATGRGKRVPQTRHWNQCFPTQNVDAFEIRTLTGTPMKTPARAPLPSCGYQSLINNKYDNYGMWFFEREFNPESQCDRSIIVWNPSV